MLSAILPVASTTARHCSSLLANLLLPAMRHCAILHHALALPNALPKREQPACIAVLLGQSPSHRHPEPAAA
jgi:hypothetical protein